VDALLQFCAGLEQRRASYRLSVERPEAVRVLIAVPGERWEVDFFADGMVEVERFVGQGVEDGRPEDILGSFDEFMR